MDEGKFAADFVAQNIDNILSIAKNVYTTVDEKVKISLKKAYTDYLIATKQKYSTSKSFFIRNQSVDLYSYYIPTGIQCDKQEILLPSFKNCLESSNRIVITGTGGSGKTVLIKHLFLDCIKDKRFAPILIELRDLNNETLSLDNFIKGTLDTYGFDVSGSFILRAKKAGHFCFFLDGLDEVDYKTKKTLLQQIKSLSNKFPKCPIFISSRPDDVFTGLDNFSVFSMIPLDVESAIKLINKLPFDKSIQNKFTKKLAEGLFEKHESFLSNPLLLSIMLLTYSENAEIPSKLSIFYNQAYEALFQRHDAYKGAYTRNRLTDLDIQDFARVFSLFSVQTYDKRVFKMPKTDCLKYIDKSRANLVKEFSPEDYLSDLLNAACLLLEDGLEISFSHRSFQEYFVARYISSAAPEIQEKLIHRYLSHISSDQVLFLLLEINPELVERVLLVPELESMFKNLGVKRKVGITHAAKYIKGSYSSLQLHKGRLTANVNTNGYVVDIGHMAVKQCNTYKFPNNDYFDTKNKLLFEKHAKAEHGNRFKTEDLTYKTPLLSDILKMEGAFSISYLQAIFEAYKILKKKHENRVQNIDELLNI